MNMRISSIDIGSNAIRQIIAELDHYGHLKVLKKHREPIRLGDDVFRTQKIEPHTLVRLIEAFKRMARLTKEYKVDRSLALATSAFRDAKNKKEIIRQIKMQSGISIQVISGQKEAALILKAVQHNTCSNNEHTLLIDIGGGSVELTHMQKKKIFSSHSFKWGMVRTLTEAQKNGITASQLVRKNLQTQIAKKYLPKGPFSLAIGTGGNLDAIGKLKLKILKKGPNTFMTQKELAHLYKSFVKTRPNERMKKFNLRPDRVDVIEPAMLLTLELMKKYNIQKLKIPGIGLKEGAVISLL